MSWEHFIANESDETIGKAHAEPEPESTDPGTRNPLTQNLADTTGWTYERAQSERRRLFRLSGSSLQSRADGARSEIDRDAARWELRRRAARRAGVPFPPADASSPGADEIPDWTRLDAGHPTDVASVPAVPADHGRTGGPAVVLDPGPVATEPALPAAPAEPPALTLAADQVIDNAVSATNPGHLEAVRDTLRALRDSMDPQDYDRSPKTCRIRVEPDGTTTVQPIMPAGLLGAPMTLTRNARQQLASFVLGPHGLNFVDRLAGKGLPGAETAGQQLASANWRLMAHAYDAPLKLRTIKRRTQREIRAVLSQTYCVYDHLDLVEDALTALGSGADDYRVIGHRLDDTMGRIRLVGGDDETLARWNAKEVDKPFPMITLSNSETGQRSVRAEGGTFTLWCSNGCGTWDAAARFRWNHTGHTSDRIRDGLSHAMDEIRVRQGQLLAAYDEALVTQISDTMAWFDAAFADQVTQGQRDQVANVLNTEETVHRDGDSPRLLASIVDAVTYVAHEQASLQDQDRLERLGAEVLRQGIHDATDRRIVIPA